MTDLFQKIKNKRPVLMFIFIGAVIYIVFMVIVLALIKDVDKPSSFTTGQIEKDYSRLDEIYPGKSTRSEVERINGDPKSVTTEGDKTYLHYQTPLENFTNTVALENNRVVYSRENVFGPYRGSVSDFKAKYGTPNLRLFEDNYPWSIYLKRGIAFQHDARDVLAVIYFVPQSKESFMGTLARELELMETPTPEE